MSTSKLAVSVSRSEGHVRLVLTGDVDLHTRDVLIGAIAHELEQPVQQLEVDVQGVVFCDSTGISGFLAARRMAAEQGTKLVLTNPSKSMRTLLTVTGLHAHLTGSSPDR